MFANYFAQLEAASRLGFVVAWIAQAHLSTETQQQNTNPIVPHWKGEVGLCTDFCQLAMESFRRTNRIDVGSAVVNFSGWRAIALAERVANTVQFLSFIDEKRKLHVGFSAGRSNLWLNHMVYPRNEIEKHLGHIKRPDFHGGE